MSTWLIQERGGVRLATLDFGGVGQNVVLLHGLAGHAGEWKETAGWLTETHRVLAPDARGHGRSERRPTDVTQSAFMDDATFLIEELASPPVILVGQSLGGLTALALAAQRPDLVEALILADAGPGGAGSAEEAEGATSDLGRSLARWPVPFPNRSAAVTYFGGPSLAAEAWADGLVQDGDGLRPSFDIPVLMQILRQAVSRSYWDEWRSIRCPTLMVRAANGVIGQNEVEMMSAQLPAAEVTELPGAKHDLHLDQPDRWREVVQEFLGSITRR